MVRDQSVTRFLAIAFCSGMVLAGIAGVVSLVTFQPIYRAVHLMERNDDFLLNARLLNEPDVDIVTQERSLILNPIVLDPVLEDPGLREAPSLSDPETASRRLRESIQVLTAGPANRFYITYEDSDPEFASLVCNSITASYLRQRSAFASTRINNLERALEPEVERWERDAELRSRQIQVLMDRSVSPELVAARERLQRLLDQQAELRIEIKVLEAMKSPDVSELDAMKKRLKVIEENADKLQTLASSARLPGVELDFAKQELEIALDILKRLRERLAEIKAERLNYRQVRSMATAIPPREPINWPPYSEMGRRCAVAFAIPFLLTLLWGAVRSCWPRDSEEKVIRSEG